MYNVSQGDWGGESPGLAPGQTEVEMTLAWHCQSRDRYEQLCSQHRHAESLQKTPADHFIATNCSYDNETDGAWVTSLALAHAHTPRLKLACHGAIWTPDVIQRIVTLAIIMALTLFGNVIIIVVLSCSKYRKLNSRVNIFIINLAIGDLTVCCFTMTTEVLFVVFEGGWVLGAAACKILLYVQIITLASTTFILTAMSFDRFMAICRPLALGTTMARARRSILISWLMAFVFASPQLLIFKQVPSGIYPDGQIMHKCRSVGYTAWWQRKLYFTFMTVYILIIPTVIICYCYINVVRVVWRQGKDVNSNSGVALRRTVRDTRSIPKAKIKTIKMTLSIILSFIMCWTPYFVVHLVHIWSEYRYEIPAPVYVLAETMALLNSALNPLLYGCFNIKLRRGLTEVFCPNKVKDRRGRSGVTECVSFPDNHRCLSAVKRLGSRCAESPSGASSSGSHNDHGAGSSNDVIHGGHVDRVETGSSKNGYRLRVRFGVNDPETNKTFGLEQQSALLADSRDRK